jgi:hypothetical protein
MKITPDEIAAIEDAGMLDQSPVRMIRTKGGFWIAVGKPRGKFKEEALSAGSHPAIVKFNLSKQYPQFEEALMKSEDFIHANSTVEQHSHFLSEDLRKSGHDVFSVQSGPEITFHVTKHGVEVGKASGAMLENSLVIKSISGRKEFARALAGAASEKALSVGAIKLRMEVK